ncbi:SAV_915 family protein [Streptomyces sp. NPDC059398]|uniref:SAV_915 family protein n=1 Tax=Streptomyces sp. NPDC059398 TaxID=3346820 RepID=UPI0036CCBB6C
MCLRSYDDDPEPEEQVPAGPLYVPVLPGPARAALRLFRTPLGVRTTVAFTEAAMVTAVLGEGQAWIVLSEPALRAMAEPLGVTRMTLDPMLTAPPVRADAPARTVAELRGPGPMPTPSGRKLAS